MGDSGPPSAPMKERLHRDTMRWLESGRDPGLLLTGKDFFAAQCWLNANPIRSPESAASYRSMNDFVLASKVAMGGEAGWIAMLNEKTICSVCGMSYHLENIGICSSCMQYVCGACRHSHAACGGEVVG